MTKTEPAMTHDHSVVRSAARLSVAPMMDCT